MLQLRGEGAEGQQRYPVPLATPVWALDVCDAQPQHANYLPGDKTLEANSLGTVRKESKSEVELSW